jgi:hypothetical protein
MFARFQGCIQRAQACLRDLKNSNQLDNSKFDLPETCQMFNFRVKINNSRYSISVSIPPDMMIGNYETALFRDEELIYNEEWGYHDIKRFDTISELIEEFESIYNKIHFQN